MTGSALIGKTGAGRSIAGVGLAVLALCASGAPRLSAQETRIASSGRSTCDVCHSEMEFLRQNTDSMARARRVLVPDRIVASSAHGALACSACHTGFRRFPHGGGATKSCASCHARASTAWRQGAHMPEEGKSGAGCAQCHGIHDVRSSEELRRKSGIAAMNGTCVGCHQTQKLSAPSPHADRVLCSGCHAPHDTRPAYDRASRLWANQQLQTCGTCHNQVAAVWVQRDVHARALLTRRTQGRPDIRHRPPTCTDCHGMHGMSGVPDSTLLQAGSERCAECHGRYADAYADTYHGQATRLGSKRTASCADCHMAHSILASDDPQSSVAKANLTATCGRCHKAATVAFTKFDPHANPHDSSNPLIFWSSRLMNWLLFGVMIFFGLHTVLWLTRRAIDRAKARRPGAREP